MESTCFVSQDDLRKMEGNLKSFLAEKETSNQIRFFLNLSKKDLLIYGEICQSIHLHKVEQGSAATDLFVKRKTSSERVVLREQIEKLENEKQELKEEVKIVRQRDEGDIREIASDNKEKLEDLLDKVETLVTKEKHTFTSATLGQQGEEWALHSIQKAFPNNSKIILVSGDSGVGDISFTVENTNKRIMFEVKNYQQGRTVKGTNKGAEIEKFFNDMKQTKLGYRYDAAVLISLHCPVDLHTPSMFPQIQHESSIPYMFIDNAMDNADSTTLFKCCVNVMRFMMKHVDTNQDPEEKAKTLDDALETTIKLQAKYQEQRKWYNSGKRPLDEMKNELDGLYLRLGGAPKTPRKAPQPKNQHNKTPDPKRLKMN